MVKNMANSNKKNVIDITNLIDIGYEINQMKKEIADLRNEITNLTETIKKLLILKENYQIAQDTILNNQETK